MTDHKKNKRFIIYVRCSTDDQSRGDYTTLDAQAHHCKNMLEALDYETARIVKDDGFSGKDLKRPGIQGVLKEIGNGKTHTFDGIIFFRLDRLTRNPRDLYALIDLFKENDIDFISVKENMDSSSALGRVVIGIIGLLSAFERELTGERVKASSIARARQGMWTGGTLPYGYKLQDTGPMVDGRQPHKVVIDAAIAQKLKLIWQMAAENKSIRTIARELEKREIKGPTGKSWRAQTVLNILRNPFYKGEMRWAGETHKGKHEQLIDAAIWEKANRVVSANLPGHRFIAKPKEYIFLLEGLLSCGQCGSRMITKFSLGESKKKFHYYICGRRNQGLGCDSMPLSAPNFDQAVISFFRNSSKDQRLIVKAVENALLEARSRLNFAGKNIVKVEKQLKTAREAAEKLIDLALNGTISKGTTYKARLEALEAETCKLENQLAKLQAQKTAAEMSADSAKFIHSNIVFIMGRFDKADPATQKAFFQALIKEIIRVH
ncbi:MAG: hypothetical protein A3G33_08180 [Omnitrophica bacterium RIFCSPLOWO2_12_FULL_44_17]|uniref:Serine recombinase n=1 Tax=Candidatus Danuiimicrobium aquiferis TaxID=1801832 RepID=A0A1G1KXY8_9BACT|nr:MAG: hypothetical protein A3B72_05880 [Omnitrophica bacterium RIFCSPHIGHO2_02_FULL_45_28]OGW89763.1 MAG: hypothetical protein A3E74_06355 [Omnitrophica bacterium RIFCSPHIGHO2_12_FULL_44_12]OGW97780.1 MAG: hypothetical protein A3G33_08180 [Omnitrophica bacterium RIFCSPLOWO2_12_FULL_44_17]OGX04967.1 MAG: hypothetical protein A3J12_02020 [Omnitrophica bacterium RIFCSPLOWO2_02_FULL_44_11]